MAAILSVGTGAGYHYIVHFYIFLFHSCVYTTHKHNIHLLYFTKWRSIYINKNKTKK